MYIPVGREDEGQGDEKLSGEMGRLSPYLRNISFVTR